MDIRKIYSSFQKFLKYLDESLFRDKGMKINFVYELDRSFQLEDINIMKSSINNMIDELENIKRELR